MKSAVQLIPASIADYPLIQNMGRFYVYDMSGYLGHQKGWELPKSGLFESIDFKKYWNEDDTYPLIIRQGTEIVGFVIVDKKGSDPQVDFNIAQFFILRKFQRKGIGQQVAFRCFQQLPGIWEVMVVPGNEGAYKFWKKVIQDYTKGSFTEITKPVAHLQNSNKIVFRFSSSKAADVPVAKPIPTIAPKKLVETYMHRIWAQKDLQAITEFVDSQAVIHSLLGEFGSPSDMKAVCLAWFTGFPDLTVSIQHLICEDDLVVAHWHASGTHLGEFKGIKPSGKKIQYNGTTIYRIRNSKIVEYWAYLDMQHLLRQII